MTTCALGDLNPDARTALDAYLAAVGASVDADLRDAVVCDLRTWMLDHLGPDSTPADVQALADEAGPVDPPAGSPADADAPGCRGTWHGIPYDFTRPTAEKIARRFWEPADPRLWRAHVFGAGWTPNFGALAVRLGLIEPDAEDVPFAATPDHAFVLAAGFPIAMAWATVLHYAVRGRSLPARLPRHWALDGRPDADAPKACAAASDLAATLIPAATAAWIAGSGRPRPARAGVLAAASGIAALGAATTVVRSLPDRRRPWVGPALAAAIFGAAGATLFGLARAGRAAEIAHDLRQDR